MFHPHTVSTFFPQLIVYLLVLCKGSDDVSTGNPEFWSQNLMNVMCSLSTTGIAKFVELSCLFSFVFSVGVSTLVRQDGCCGTQTRSLV